MEYRNVKISEIAPNKGQVEGLPANPRKWTKSDVAKLADSIQETPELLAARGLILYPYEGQYVVVGGNMRLEAIRATEATYAPAYILPEEMDGEKLREIAIKDNSSFGAWDYTALLEQWSDVDLSGWGVSGWEDIATGLEQGDTYEDTPPEPGKVEARVQTGDIWTLGNHRLVCGDSADPQVIRDLMQGEQASLYLTDPPYNVDYTGGGGQVRERIQGDNQNEADFVDFLSRAFSSANPHLLPGAAIYIWLAVMRRTEFDTAYKAIKDWHKAQELVWVKSNIVIAHNDYHWQHEACLYGWKTGAPHYFTPARNQHTLVRDDDSTLPPDLSAMSKAELREYCEQLQARLTRTPTDVIRAPKPLASKDHPTTKPVNLFGQLIANSSKEGDIILDSFGGSGTTVIVAEQLRRKARVVEIAPTYCDVILTRWEQLTEDKATLSRRANNEI